MLEFHVWGPACGLPSIDAESLALITYASFVLPPTAFTLVTTSPSAVPSHVLPSLYDRATGSWVSGYRPIVSHLASSSSSRLDHDPDARLTPAQRADADALAAFLASRAAPLVALSLYASHTNWSEVVRPAYSRILPFPLTWVEPPLVRDAMLQRAEGLGLDDLDPDAEVPPEGAETSGRPRAPPPSLKTIADYINQGRLGATDRISEETRAVNKLRSTARTSCLDPLAQALSRAAPDDALSFVAAAAGGGDGRAPTSVDCLAYAYLSLMLVPDLPRRWLPDLLASEPSLAALTAFTSALRAAIPPAAPLTLSGATTSSSSLAARFLRGALRSAPHVGDALHARDLRRRAATSDDIARRQQRRRDLLHAFCAAVLGSALVAGVLAWRRMPAFGEAVYRWSRPVRGFGAAGALLGLYGSSSSAGVSFGGGGGGHDGGDDGFRAPQGYAGGGGSGVGSGLGGEYEEVPIEMSGRPEVVEVDVEVGSGSS